MNSLLRIRIQVTVEKAAEIANLAKTLKGLGSISASSTPGVAALGEAARKAARHSKEMSEGVSSLQQTLKAADTRPMAAGIDSLTSSLRRFTQQAADMSATKTGMFTLPSGDAAQKIKAMGDAMARVKAGGLTKADVSVLARMGQVSDDAAASIGAMDVALGRVRRGGLTEKDVGALAQFAAASEDTANALRRVEEAKARVVAVKLGLAIPDAQALNAKIQQSSDAMRELDDRLYGLQRMLMGLTSKSPAELRDRIAAASSETKMLSERMNGLLGARQSLHTLFDASDGVERTKKAVQDLQAQSKAMARVQTGGLTQADVNVLSRMAATVGGSVDDFDRLSAAMGRMRQGGMSRQDLTILSGMTDAAKSANRELSELEKTQRSIAGAKLGIQSTDSESFASRVTQGIGSAQQIVERFSKEATKDLTGTTKAMRQLSASFMDDPLMPPWARMDEKQIERVQQELYALDKASNLKFGQKINAEMIKATSALKLWGKASSIKSHEQELRKANADRVKAERDVLDQIKSLRDRYASKAMSASVASARFGALRDAHPANSKASIAAAKALAKVADDQRRQQEAADRKAAAARIRVERDTLEEIVKLRKQYEAKLISGTDYKAGLSGIRLANPDDSKAGISAALAIRRYDDAMRRSTPASKSFMELMEGKTQAMERFGKDMQWTGRQIEYNFTLPLVRAASAVFDLQMSNERALTNLVKVYGDGTDAADGLSTRMIVLGQNLKQVNRGEMSDAEEMAYDLGRAFRALSDGFGVSMDQVSQIGAMWAATGEQGAGLAYAVRNTLEAMMIGDFSNTEEAFKSIIKVQQGYVLSADQVTQAMAMINIAENMTAAQFTDLVNAMGRGAATMRTAGVSLREFTAMLTLLIPSNTAETAGNGMKTLMSRIMAPTDRAKEAIAELGVVMDETFYSMTGTERLMQLAKSYEAAGSSQKQFIAEAVAGRYQINRFDLLMQGLIDTNSTYYKVLNATADGLGANSNAMKTYQSEILEYLKSTPKTIDIAKTMITNTASAVMVDLLPAILQVLQMVQWLAQEFNELDPQTQRYVLLGLVLLAVVGPMMRVAGAAIALTARLLSVARLVYLAVRAIWSFLAISKLFVSAWGLMGRSISAVTTRAIPWLVRSLGHLATRAIPWLIRGIGQLATRALPFLLRALVQVGARILAAIGPWGWLALAIAALGVVLWRFRDTIIRALGSAFSWAGNAISSFIGFIGRSFGALPTVIGNALMAVVRVIASAVMAAWEWLQWLNPFQRHSPSLVDNVTAGVAIIAAEYASLGNIGAIYSRAAAGLRDFAAATADIRSASVETERNDTRTKIAATSPELIPAVNGMFGQMDALQGAMRAVTAEIEAQERVVNALDVEYRRLDRSLEVAEAGLRKLERAAESIKEKLDAAKAKLDGWADTPIEGSRALSDALFENELAQKRLRLEMLRMEDAGENIEAVRDKLALLQGEIETLSALQSDLRSAGAGSEITGPIQAQIDALRAEAQALGSGTGGSAYARMEEELKRLQREAEMMDLEGALRFDPLRRQIERFVDTTKEATFEEIMAGLIETKTIVDQLTVEYENAKAAVDAQKPAVDILRTAHDDLGDTLNFEKDRLQALKDGYGDLEQMYRDISEAIQSLVSDLDILSAASANAAGAGGGAGGGIPGGEFAPGEGVDGMGLPTEEDMRALADQFLEDFRKGFADFNPFEAIKTKWEDLKTWFTDKWDAMWGWAADRLDDVKGWFGAKIDGMVEFFKKLNPMPFVESAWNGFKNFLSGIWNGVVTLFVTGWNAIKGAFSAAGNFIGGIATFIGGAITTIKNFFSNLDQHARTAWNGVVSAIETAAGFIESLMFEKIPYAIGFLIGEFLALPIRLWEGMGDVGSFLWDNLKAGFEFLKTNAGSIVDAVVDFFAKLPGRAWDAVGDIGTFLWNNMKSGWDWLSANVGRIADSVVDFFKKLPGRVWDAVGDLGASLWNNVKSGFDTLKTSVGSVVDELYGFFEKLPTRISSMAGTVLDAASGIGSAIKNGVISALGGSWDVASDLVSAIRRGITSVYNDIIDRIQGAINGAIRGFNNSGIGEFITIPLINIQWAKLPWYHEGGIVGGPRGADVPAVLQAGEGILSLRMMDLIERATSSKPPAEQGMVSTDNSRTVNIYGDLSFPNIDSGEDAEKFIRNLESLAVR